MFRGGRVRLLAVVSLLLGATIYLTGCLIVDATLKSDGSGTIDLTYPWRPARGKEDVQRKRFSSEHVRVESWEALKEQARVKVTFDDVTKLSTAKGFKDVTVTRTRESDAETLLIVITKPRPIKRPTDKPGPTFKVTLPGKALEANRGAQLSGNTVTWKLDLATYAAEPKTDLKVRYAAAGPSPKEDEGSGGGDGNPAKGNPAKGKAADGPASGDG
jgi:hypothetical protein